MKRSIIIIFMICTAASAFPGSKKRFSQFTGDLNGDGHTDIVIVDRTNYTNPFGMVKVFFGNAAGIDSIAGWVYFCNQNNFLESDQNVSIVGDINGDGIDDLCMLLANLKGGKSGRSHQDIFVFYGRKENFGTNPIILKVEKDQNDKTSIRDFFGFDYNGDGITDILAVSSKRNYKIVESGWTDTEKKLIIFYGSDTGIMNFEILRDIDDVYFKLAGDINNDGKNDMLLAEPSKNKVVWTQYLSNNDHKLNSKPFISYELPKIMSNDKIFNGTVWDFNGDKYDDDLVMHENGNSFWHLKKQDSVVYTIDFYPGSREGLKDSISYTWSIKTAPGVGLNITPCGDLNGDGFGDFILKRFTLVTSGLPVVEAMILWGGKDEMHLDTSGNFNKLFHSIYMVSQGRTSVDALGDINNDGYTDILLGVETVAFGNKDGSFTTMKLNFLD